MKKKLLFLALAGLLPLVACQNGAQDSSSTSQEEQSSHSGGDSSSSSSSSTADISSSESETSSSSAETSSSSSEESSSSDSSSSEEVHVHSYNDDNICECGQTKLGAYAVDIDGDPSDWNNTVRGKKLETYGTDGRGFEVMSFVDDTYMFVYAKVVSASSVVQTCEIVYGEGKQINISRGTEEGTYSFTSSDEEAKVTFVVSQEYSDETQLYETHYEYMIRKSYLEDANGDVKCGFDVNVPDEESAASYSDAQLSYWVLYGINAWNAPDYMTIREDGIEHNHIYDSDYVCIICGESQPQDDYAITVDGANDDWPEAVKEACISTVDGDGRQFTVYGFLDENYVYIYALISHYCDHVGTFEILSLNDGTWKEIYAINNGSTYSYNTSIIKTGKYQEKADDTGLLIETSFELVLTKADVVQSDGSVRLGFSSNLGDESSSRLGYSDTQSTWWTLGKCNSWDSSSHFTITETGIPHNHKYDEDGNCYFCDAVKPISYAITVDASSDDWPEKVKSNLIRTYGTEGTGFEAMSFVDDKFMYVYVKVVSVTSEVNLLEVIAKNDNSGYIAFRLDDSVPSGVVAYEWSQNLVEEQNVTIFEAVIEIEAVADSDGSVSAAFSVNVNEKSAASYSDDNIAYWNIGGTNAWSVADHMPITEDGIQHTHKYGSDDTCLFCGSEKPSEGIVLDGDSSDWSSAILATALSTEGADNRLFSVCAFVQDDLVYFFVTLQCVANTQNTVSLVFDCATEYKIVYNGDGLSSKTDNISEAAVNVAYDETLAVYKAQLEFTVAKASITNAAGETKVGIDCWVSEADADATLGFAESGSQSYWWVINKANSWDTSKNFVITEKGINQ